MMRDGKSARTFRPATLLVPEEASSILFRGKFRDILARQNLLHLVDPAVWQTPMGGRRMQAVGDGSASLPHLAPYVFRGGDR